MLLEMEAITIRLEQPADAAAIEALAGRDSRPVPGAPRLVAERRGAIEAVLSLSGGAVIADPFLPTAELVELLRCRARSLVAEPPRPRSRRRFVARARLAGAGGRA